MKRKRERDRYLFLCEAGTETNDIHNVTLYDTNIGKLFAAESIQLFTLALLALLLLCLTLDAEAARGEHEAV